MTIGRLQFVAAGVVLVSAALGDGPALRAQSPRPMTLVDVAEVPRVLDPQLSPDGRFVVYWLGKADWKANRQVYHLWRQDTSGGTAVQLTSGQSGETTPRWAPDGHSLLFLARGEGDTATQIYLIAADGGRARPLTHHATSVAGPAWAPGGTAIYFVADDPATPAERDRDRGDDVYAVDGNFKQQHLWKIDVATGAEQRITSGDWSVAGFRVSADGTRIVVQRAPTPLPADAHRSEVWLMDASGANAHQLTKNDVEEVEAEVSPDNTQVLFVAEAGSHQEPYFNNNVFVVSSNGGPARTVVPDFKYAVDHAAWAPDGRSILAVVNMGLHSEVFRMGLDGKTRQLTDGPHSVQFWSVAPKTGRMVFQLDEPARLGDAWTLEADGSSLKRVTGVYDTLEREFRLPRQDRVSWKSADGTPVEGLLIYPLDYRPGTRYPLVVQLHGGPNESDKFGAGPGYLVNYFPVLAARGYAVLRPNYRGSAGYGNRFFRDIIGGYFSHQPDDVLSGVDALIASGLADPDRLAVMGWSAGAHLTNKLVTYTTRFKAASSTAGVANWMSMYAETDTRASRSVWFGGTPWETDGAASVYWDNSPLKYIANTKTPLLLFAGEADQRVPLPQSLEMYRALQAHGVPSKLYVGPREGHQWHELRHQLFKANAELEWFEKYVRDRAYVWERAPG